jgi:hypothetical protein
VENHYAKALGNAQVDGRTGSDGNPVNCAARRPRRTAVQSDVHVLVNAGLIDRTDEPRAH